MCTCTVDSRRALAKRRAEAVRQVTGAEEEWYRDAG
jgi:hypothetical protein